MNGLLNSDEERYAQIISEKKEEELSVMPASQVKSQEDKYRQVIQEKKEQEDEVLRQSLMASVEKNPDQMAQIERLAAESNMPIEVVQRNMAVMIRDKRVAELKQAARVSPVLARQLSDPSFAALAHDDTDRLSTLETIITKPFDLARAGAEGIVGPVVGSGVFSGTGQLYGIGVRNLENVLDRLLPNSAMSFLRTPVPWYASPEGLFTTIGGGFKALAKTIGPPDARRGFDTEVAGAIGQLGGQIALTLINPALSTVTLFGQGADIMADMVEGDDASQVQKDLAIIAGSGITALTERIGLDLILNKLPPTIRNRTLRYIANAAMGGGIEAAQEVTEGLMHDLARRFLTNEDAPLLEGAVDEASVAAVAGAIVRAALTKRSYTRAAQQEEFFRALGDDAKASKLRERMPDKFQEYINNLTQGSPVKEVYISSDRFNTYFQSKNENPAQKAAEFGAVNYMEAVAAGTDIVIPLNDFTAKLAPTDDLQGLFPDLRLEVDGLSPREFEQYKAEEQEKLDQILADAQRAVGEAQAPAFETIFSEVTQQLMATGYERSTAEAYATAYSRAIIGLSSASNLDPKTVHDQYSLNATRPLPEILTRDRRSDANIDPLLDRLRKGDVPGQREIYGKSLVDFLIEQGGLRQYGELTDVDIGRGAFQRKLVQETGLDADTAAQLAVEAGYLQGRGYEDVTERDLFDAIDEEMGGAPQFSVMQVNEQLQSLADQLQQLEQFLQQIGVDLSQITDNAQVRRLIEQASQSPELQDAIEPLFQAAQPPRQPGDNLLAIHDLTEEKLKFTAKMGGLASPSVGVVTDMKGMVEGFGDITLIGTKDLVDPSVEPVFSADAYTVRYPSPEWNKPKRADADALYDIANQADQIIDTGIAVQTEGLTTRDPNGGRLVSHWLNSDAIRALYLQQQGVAFDIVRDPVRSEINLTVEQLDQLRPLYDVVNQQQNQGIRESAELEQLRNELAGIMRTFYEQKGIRPQLIDSIVERYTRNPAMTLGNEYGRQQRGPQINRAETAQNIQDKIDPVFEDFRKWVEDNVLSRFDDPFLTIGRKKVPYTLDNIVKVVTSKKEQRAVEKTMAYGDAKTKASAALQFSDIEQMRQVAKETIVQPEDFATARQESQETMESYREMMASYPHEVTDNATRRDDAMKAIAQFSTSKTKTPEAMRKALAAQGFQNVDQISDSDIQFAMDAAEQLIRLPVPYFEAKPQRIVKLNEFAGAVVPLDASQDVIDILESNGMRVEFHEGFDRQEAVQRLANQLATEREGILFQEERGFIQFGKERKFNITLLEKADLSTFLHETGHFYLEVMGDLAQLDTASPVLKEDYQTVLSFLGLKSRDELTLDGKDSSSAAYKKAVAAHEKFARAHEAYLMEGKAPSMELRQVFQKFKNWLKMIYKDFLRLDVKLNDNVRAVFDRIYATDQEIDAAKGEMSVDPLLIDAATAGMTDAEFATYQESVQQASEAGKEALLQRLMSEMQRERQAWWKSELANVKEEVGKEFDEMPAYQAFKTLTETDTKLNKAELVERYGEEYLKRVPRGFQRVYTTKEGVPLELVARESGFPTGDSLVEALVALPNRREYVNAEAERRMLERHGDMMTDGSISDQAKVDLHNKFREKMLMTELRALRRKAAEVRPFVQAERKAQQQTRRELRQAINVLPASAFRQAAQGIIGQTAVRDIQPQRFLSAERKHGKEAERALINGDPALAADAKQKELLNHFLYLEAVKARDESDKIANYMRKFESKSVRERIGKAGKTYLDQIDAILDGYEFRRIPNRQIDRRATLQAFVEKMQSQARGEEDLSADPVYIPQSVLDDARQINYRQLSFDELQAVNEAVRNIDNVARLKNKLLKLAERRELDDVVSQAFDQIRSNTRGGLSKTLESQSKPERYKRFAKGFMLIHTKFATMAQQMDGWKENGFFWNLFIRPMNEAATFEAVERAKVSKQLADLFKPYRDTNMTTKQYIPSLGAAMSLEARLTVALNWGRPENRQRLIDGNGFTQQNINDIFATLDSRDWQFVQGSWELLGSYWPMIEAQYTRLYGVPPKKAEIIGFNTKEGEIAGGYYPISYDPTKSSRAMAQSDTDVLEQMKSGSYVRSMTKNGFTKEAMEHVDRPIKLDLSGMYEHLNTVIHDLSLREYLIDVNKIMNHRFDRTTLKDVIIDSYGDQFYKEIITTIKDVTIGDISAQNAFDASLGHLRNGVAIVGMGWSLWTGLMQPMGLTQSMVKIGPKWVAKGLAKWGGDIFKLQNTAGEIYGKSEFMRTRYLTQNREINDIRNRIKRQGKFPIAKETYGVVEDSYFQLIIQFQKLVDIPTWVGQYEKSLDMGQDEATAIAMADQAVLDSQSGGALKDLARIQRGSPLLKIWTVFYSYFNTTFNLMRGSIGRTDFRDPVSIGRLAGDVFLTLLAPAILTTVLREAVNIFKGGEPSDEEDLIEAYIQEQIGYILGTVVGVREFAALVDPRFSYSGPAGVRIVGEAQRLAIQVSQGELDSALRRSAVTVGGILLHYPAGQINRIIDGMLALEEGSTDKPGALIFGAPR
jgi:hypothetical protein